MPDRPVTRGEFAERRQELDDRHDHDRHVDRYRLRAIVKVGMIMGLIVAVVSVSALTAVVRSNAAMESLRKRQQVEHFLAQRGIRREARANYRICSRAVMTNAEFILTSRRDSELVKDGPFHDALIRRAKRVAHRLPLLDCTPNLIGQAAIELTKDQAERYLYFYNRHSSPPQVRHTHVYMREAHDVIATNATTRKP
jgi:hypothetical protein